MGGFWTPQVSGFHSQHLLKGIILSIFTTAGRNVDGMSMAEAIAHANLDWTVTTQPVLYQHEAEIKADGQYYANVRQDTGRVLGIVGSGYRVIQNSEVAAMAEAINGKNVRIETVGNLYQGERIWFLMRGDSFNVGNRDDEVRPYTLLTNAHNGKHTLSVLPTTVRVICENTLNAALRRSKMSVTIKHTGNIQSRISSLLDGIEFFRVRTEEFAKQANLMAQREVTTDFVQTFWTNIYMSQFGEIHENPVNADQADDNSKAVSTMIKWSNTFDSESRITGANLWTAANAVTNWLDHDQIYRGNNKTDNKFDDILFGDRAKAKIRVMEYALQHA